MANLDLGKVTGENGQGVASGGTAGQLLKKASSSDYDTAWVSPDTAAAAASGNPITSGAVYDALGTTQSAIAIMSDNNTHAAITSGQYVYVRNHGTLAEGLYQATANIAQNGTLSASNLTAVSGGGLNALNSKITEIKTATIQSITTLSSGWARPSPAINVNNITIISASVVNNYYACIPADIQGDWWFLVCEANSNAEMVGKPNTTVTIKYVYYEN